MPMVRVSNGGTSQGNPPTTEIFKAVSTSNTAPVIVPTFGHNMKIKDSGSNRMHIYGIKFKDFARDNSLFMVANTWNSYVQATAGFTDLGLTTTTYTSYATKDYDLITLYIRSSSAQTNTIYITWE